MNPEPSTIAAAVGIALVALVVLFLLDTQLKGRARATFRWVAVFVVPIVAIGALSEVVKDYARRVDVVKAAIALAAAGLVFYETQRAASKQPVSERWKRIVGVTLAVASIVCYFNAFNWGYPKYYHRWDQYHYYMGAKYFKELGYDGLYKCSVIAEDDIGAFEWTNEDNGRKMRFDLSKEVRAPDKKIRNLSGDNLLVGVDDLLANPEQCRSRFTPERWEAYKEDVKHFRLSCWDGKQYWEDMQRDHGYNPPPVWTLGGKIWAELHPASTRYLQFLGTLDVFYMLAMFVGIWWAFGWRIFALSAILWGTQSSAPSYWTLGAFLRQDWLFWLVMAACFARKRWFAMAGASMVYAGLLRVFPGLCVIGWLTVAGIHLVKYRRMAPDHKRALFGGVLAAAILIPASLWAAGPRSYQQFFHHTIGVHDQTPLTNHMGLRVMIGHGVGSDWSSGRMKYTKDTKLTDPFESWKTKRLERYKKYKPLGYALMAGTFVLLLAAHRRMKSLWVAQCLGQIWIVLLSQLTCYYYSFMILLAPLTRVHRQLEVPILLWAALSQITWMMFYWNDDKYSALTWISTAMIYAVIAWFLPRGVLDRVRGAFGGGKPTAPAARSSSGSTASSGSTEAA